MALTEKSAHRKDVGKIAEMQHRHFATIATILAGLRDMDLTAWQTETLHNQFADMLARTNPKFDRARFLRACKP